MTNNTDKLFEDLRTLALRSEEKSELRGRIEKRIRESGTPVVSPISGISAGSAIASMVFVRAWKQYAPLALGLILVVGIGTSYAAGDSLPGEPLYPVKIYINEGLESALARTPQASAKIEAAHALKRLDEAETLAREGRLDAQTHKNIKATFATKIEKMDKDIQALQREGNMASSIEVNMEFEKELTKREAILTALVDENTSAPAIAAVSEKADEVRAMKIELMQEAARMASTSDDAVSVETQAGAAMDFDDEDGHVRTLLQKIRDQEREKRDESGKGPRLEGSMRD